MWQKVNPKCFRLKVNTTWDSRWYVPLRKLADCTLEDLAIRGFFNKKLKDSWISKILISRTNSKIYVDIYTSKPGVIIWRQWAQIDDLKKLVDKKFNKNIEINIKEIKKPETEAPIVAENIARSIEKRIAYRRAAKQAIAKSMEAWALWVKIFVAWRLNWAEIARWEYYKEWTIPLQTLRSDISYATERANTTYWVIWIKVWIYRWQVFNNAKKN